MLTILQFLQRTDLTIWMKPCIGVSPSLSNSKSRTIWYFFNSLLSSVPLNLLFFFQLRQEIWKSLLPKKIKLADDVDWKLLAMKFEVPHPPDLDFLFLPYVSSFFLCDCSCCLSLLATRRIYKKCYLECTQPRRVTQCRAARDLSSRPHRRRQTTTAW